LPLRGRPAVEASWWGFLRLRPSAAAPLGYWSYWTVKKEAGSLAPEGTAARLRHLGGGFFAARPAAPPYGTIVDGVLNGAAMTMVVEAGAAALPPAARACSP